MNSNKTAKIFVVDDDPMYLKMIEIEFLQYPDFKFETYATGEICIENLSHKPDLIILDYQLDGIDKQAMNGIQTLDKIKEINPFIPVVMLSAQDKIEVAIECIHHKAFDYIVKSETAFLKLKKVISAISDQQKLEESLEWYMERMLSRLNNHFLSKCGKVETLSAT
jgi:two-component system OmpR family response regulator